MSREFNIIKNYYSEGEDIYKKNKFKLNTGVSVLVGCNGSGKTTLIRQIKNQLDENDIRYIHFDNLVDGGSNAREKAGFYEDFQFLSQSLCSSEGENIFLNISRLAQKIGAICKKYRNEKELWILLDAIDSGLSIDNIISLKDLFDCILEDNSTRSVYIVISANEYELARNAQCFDVYNCKYITFKDYEDYRNFIIKSAKIKENRYNKK